MMADRHWLSAAMPAGGRSPFLSPPEKGHGLLKCASRRTRQVANLRKARVSFRPFPNDLPGIVVPRLLLARGAGEFLSPVGLKAGEGERPAGDPRNV